MQSLERFTKVGIGPELLAKSVNMHPAQLYEG